MRSFCNGSFEWFFTIRMKTANAAWQRVETVFDGVVRLQSCERVQYFPNGAVARNNKVANNLATMQRRTRNSTIVAESPANSICVRVPNRARFAAVTALFAFVAGAAS
jgi:hypothetical protein